MINDDEIEDEVLANPVNRCYHCKKLEFTQILRKSAWRKDNNCFWWFKCGWYVRLPPRIAGLIGIKSNKSAEIGGLTKSDIRELSHELGLRTWNKPALACLGSRIPYGERITIEKWHELINRKTICARWDLFSSGCEVTAIWRVLRWVEERTKLFDEKLLDTISKQLKSYGYQYVVLKWKDI